MDIAYALDIGVYYTGPTGQVLNETTSAWCRLDRGLTNLNSLHYIGTPTQGRFTNRKDRPEDFFCSCGRSIKILADSIVQDFKNGHRVAIGFEAPMWLPLERQHKPHLRLFVPRFHAEKGSEWYLQSGAAATLKAISLGMMLRNYLKESPNITNRTTDINFWRPKTLLCFEAFVVGPYKCLDFQVASTAPNEWDAFTAALAWGALNLGFSVPASLNALRLHKPGGRHDACLSVWNIIFNEWMDSSGPPDCEVVALCKKQITQPLT